jgi:protein-tyrosine phosphatase
MAHGLLQHKADELGMDLFIDSAGTSGWHENELPDARAMATMLDHGVDISYQRSRPVRQEDFQTFDILFAMDTSNYNNLLNMARSQEEQAKVRMILNEDQPGSNRAVPDPYYGNDNGFERVYKLLDKATDAFLDSIKPF